MQQQKVTKSKKLQPIGPGVVANAFNLSIPEGEAERQRGRGREVEAGGSLSSMLAWFIQQAVKETI